MNSAQQLPEFWMTRYYFSPENSSFPSPRSNLFSQVIPFSLDEQKFTLATVGGHSTEVALAIHTRGPGLESRLRSFFPVLQILLTAGHCLECEWTVQ